MPGSFFDTNVLVYIASGDPVKADRAEAIVGDGGVISVQVLNELTNVARRKMLLSWPDTAAFCLCCAACSPSNQSPSRLTRPGLRSPSATISPPTTR